MDLFLDSLGLELVDSFGQLCLELGALALVALVVGRLLRTSSPALRHFLWVAVLFKPIIAVLVSSPWTLFAPIFSWLKTSGLFVDQSLSVGSSGSLPVAGAPALAAGGGLLPQTTVGWAAVVWVLVAALLLGRITLGYYVSRSIRSPMVLGILKPVVVVPADLPDRLSSDELTMTLMHELASVAALAAPRSSLHLSQRRTAIMNVLGIAESDLALRIRRAISGRTRRMSTRSRVLATVLLCGVCAVSLPSIGLAGDEDGIDWEAIRNTAPADWSAELRAQLAAAGHDVEAIAERVRLGQQAARDGNPDAGDGDRLHQIGSEIRAAIGRGEITPEEGRARYEAARQRLATNGEASDDRLEQFKVGVIARAMAQDPAEWNDRLKAAIVRAGWVPEAIAERVRQARKDGEGSLDLTGLEVTNTAVEARSWGQVKAEVAGGE